MVFVRGVPNHNVFLNLKKICRPRQICSTTVLRNNAALLYSTLIK